MIVSRNRPLMGDSRNGRAPEDSSPGDLPGDEGGSNA
jgi:hypothetical protein